MELLFQDDAYLKSVEAKVVSVGENGVMLDKTIFYPLGGCQPGDSGTLTRADGTEAQIIEARKGDSFGEVVANTAELRLDQFLARDQALLCLAGNFAAQNRDADSLGTQVGKSLRHCRQFYGRRDYHEVVSRILVEQQF